MFEEHTQNQHAKSLANYMPLGDYFKAKNITTTNLWKLLYSFAAEFLRVENKVNEICTQHDITQTTNLIEEWENTVGIPDDCFTVADNITDRRNNILLKLFSNGVSTEQNFIDLAAILGITIRIETLGEYSSWPWTWTHTWSGTGVENRLTMVVIFVGETAPYSWPWTWPHTWSLDDSSALRCLIQKLIPAYTQVIFRYE